MGQDWVDRLWYAFRIDDEVRLNLEQIKEDFAVYQTQNVVQRREHDNNPSECRSSFSRGDSPLRCLHVCYVVWFTWVKYYCTSLSVTTGSAKPDRTECNFAIFVVAVFIFLWVTVSASHAINAKFS